MIKFSHWAKLRIKILLVGLEKREREKLLNYQS